MKKLFCLFLASYFVFSISQGQNPGYKIDALDYSYGKFMKVQSTSMSRELPILVFTPSQVDVVNRRFPVVYMLHGTNDMLLTEEGLRKMYNPSTRMQEMADMFKVIIVAPLIGNTYYMDSPVMKESKFATFIGQELPAFIDENFKTEPNRKDRILCGFSMGGYGAVSLLCRFPDTFSMAIERAGVLNLATGIEDLQWDKIDDNISRLLGDYYTNGANYHLNSCFNLINHIRERKDIAFVIEVGKDDFLYKTNHAFHLRLDELKIPNIYNETEGGHEWSPNSLRSLLSDLQYFNPTEYR
jgi:S-formylglutathione hydrolase FrmB